MNPFQKAGVFSTRCVAVYCVATGLSGFVYAGMSLSERSLYPSLMTAYAASHGVRVIGGIVALWFAVPIGKLLGRGLE